VVMAFGGNTQVRNTQISPPGDALVAFALPQQGQGGSTSTIQANVQDIPKGEAPDSALKDIEKSAPADAQLVELKTHDILFDPNHFSTAPGARIAVKLVNVEPAEGEHNFFVALPDGWQGMKGTLKPGEAGYFTFTAPQQPGTYMFWCDVETHRFHGMVGTMTVDASVSQPVAGPSIGGRFQLPASGQMSGGAFVELQVPPPPPLGEKQQQPATQPPGQGGAPAVGMPRTGNGGKGNFLWLSLIGLALLGLGAGTALRKRTRADAGEGEGEGPRSGGR
jgi:plastocyanin